MNQKDSKRQRLWAEAKQRCRLSDEALRMARELGLNPVSLIKNIPAPSQQWKAPVEEWVREMYEKRYGARSNRQKVTVSTSGERAGGSPSRA